MKQTLSEENYLKAIYHLSNSRNEKVSATAIAQALGNNSASIIDMLKKLKEKNLIEYDKKKGASLTVDGQKSALGIIRKHRLWEVFLVEKLEFTWDEIHEIAEELEHIHHSDLADRLDKFLGYPKYDPHGDPIPKSNGELPAVFDTKLKDIEEGSICQVVGVKDTSAPFLKYLQQLNVGIGTKIEVLQKIAFDNSLVIKIADAFETTVSVKFSENIVVA